MKLGCTGEARHLSAGEIVWVRHQLMAAVRGQQADNLEFFSGGAIGVDTVWFTQAVHTRPLAKFHLVLPQAPFNAKLLTWARAALLPDNLEVHTADPGNTLSDAYMNRNLLLARLLGPEGRLQAFPGTHDEVQRSGTWATVRRVRRVGCTISYFPLSDA